MTQTTTHEKKTTRTKYRMMKIVRWENGRPIKQDREGNLWKLSYLYAINGAVIKSVPKTLIEVLNP